MRCVLHAPKYPMQLLSGLFTNVFVQPGIGARRWREVTIRMERRRLLSATAVNAGASTLIRPMTRGDYSSGITRTAFVGRRHLAAHPARDSRRILFPVSLAPLSSGVGTSPPIRPMTRVATLPVSLSTAFVGRRHLAAHPARDSRRLLCECRQYHI